MYKINFLLYGGIALGAVIVLIFTYQIVRKLRKHGTTHKPQVMNKINDFYSAQDSSHTNY